MKKFKKSTAIIFTCLFAVIMVIGFLLSYVPITVGNKTFVSLSGTINISPDTTGGMYGEFDIKTEDASMTDIVDSMNIIQEVFEDDGYKNVNVYAVGNEKIRVELSYPRGSKKYTDVHAALTNIGTGAFSLRNEYELSDKSVVVQGSSCVKEVKIYTNNDTKYISIVFNEAGQKAYKNLVDDSSTIYLALGDYAQSIEASNVTDYTQFTLSDSDYENLSVLAKRIRLGCMDVEINSDTISVSTMSASLSAGESSSIPTENSFKSSTAFVVTLSTLGLVCLLLIVAFAVKFGYFAVLVALSMIFNSYIFVVLMSLIPSVEVGLSGLATAVIGVTLIYTYVFMYASRVKAEYKSGKSLAAALEAAFKKTFVNTLIGNIMLLVTALVLFAFAFGEISSVAIITAICAFISLFTSFALVPFMVKIGISFGNFGRKLFMLKKRSLSDELSEDSDVELAKEAN